MKSGIGERKYEVSCRQTEDDIDILTPCSHVVGDENGAARGEAQLNFGRERVYMASPITPVYYSSCPIMVPNGSKETEAVPVGGKDGNSSVSTVVASIDSIVNGRSYLNLTSDYSEREKLMVMMMAKEKGIHETLSYMKKTWPGLWDSLHWDDVSRWCAETASMSKLTRREEEETDTTSEKMNEDPMDEYIDIVNNVEDDVEFVNDCGHHHAEVSQHTCIEVAVPQPIHGKTKKLEKREKRKYTKWSDDIKHEVVEVYKDLEEICPEIAIQQTLQQFHAMGGIYKELQRQHLASWVSMIDVRSKSKKRGRRSPKEASKAKMRAQSCASPRSSRKG